MRNPGWLDEVRAWIGARVYVVDSKINRFGRQTEFLLDASTNHLVQTLNDCRDGFFSDDNGQIYSHGCRFTLQAHAVNGAVASIRGLQKANPRAQVQYSGNSKSSGTNLYTRFVYS